MDYLLQLPHQLSTQLKSLRRVAGMSQAELAELMGVSQSRVAAIERDPASISVRQLMEILRLLEAQLVIRARGSADGRRDVEGRGLPPGWQARRARGTW